MSVIFGLSIGKASEKKCVGNGNVLLDFFRGGGF